MYEHDKTIQAISKPFVIELFSVIQSLMRNKLAHV